VVGGGVGGVVGGGVGGVGGGGGGAIDVGGDRLAGGVDQLGEFGDAVGLSARAVDDQHDLTDSGIAVCGGEVGSEDGQRCGAGDVREQVRIAEYRTGDGDQGDIAAHGDGARVLQGAPKLGLECLNVGLAASRVPFRDTPDFEQRVGLDRPGRTENVDKFH